VKLVDLFLLEQEATSYLIMDYIQGKNLKEYIRTYGPLPYQNAAMFIIEALKAIAFAHDRGVVHNDIKPSNIMLSDFSEIKVIDFGISIDLQAKLDVQNMFTPYYASPEQTTPGMTIDHRTDIYSMGISLYELVSGSTPFANRGLSKSQLLQKISSEHVPSLKSYQAYDKPFEKKLNLIIATATMKDPEYRYQTCEDFIDDLSELIN
jgi:serine/threonine-protein kinase